MRKKTTKCRFDSVSRNADGSISIRKAPRKKQNGVGNTKVAKKKNNATKAKLSMKSEVQERRVILDIPIRTKSEANCFEHWRVKHKRHKEQQALVALALKPVRTIIQLPCSILLTRLAPTTLDKHDNLPMSFKYIVDACCAIITGNFVSGKADSDERISIAYDQIATKEYGIKIEVSW